ncbi:MAG TPA: hypothetical protein PLX05_06730 [Acinetobacter parvus]|jgi:uncharacterized membrane protein|nr:hypothetical protein [Acinetobacter parvus]HRM15317.1 hypothetical protein [Acinetobacter parvus]
MGFVVIFIVVMIYIALKAGAREIQEQEQRKNSKQINDRIERDKKE